MPLLLQIVVCPELSLLYNCNYLPAQLGKLKEELLKSNKLKTLSYEDRKYEELINLKWLFFLILLLLGSEWFLRKRNAAL